MNSPTGVPKTLIWQIYGGSSIFESISQEHLLLSSIYFGFGKKRFFPSFCFFLGLQARGALSSFLLYLFKLRAQAALYRLDTFIVQIFLACS